METRVKKRESNSVYQLVKFNILTVRKFTFYLEGGDLEKVGNRPHKNGGKT